VSCDSFRCVDTVLDRRTWDRFAVVANGICWSNSGIGDVRVFKKYHCQDVCCTGDRGPHSPAVMVLS